KSSSFELSDESEYQIHVSFYDPSGGKRGINVENTGAAVTMFVPSVHKIGAEKDSQVFKLRTHSIDAQKVTIFSRLLGVNYDATPSDGIDYRVLLEWTVKKKWTRTWQFGILLILGTVGAGLAKLATDDLSKFTWNYVNTAFAVSGSLFIGLAGAL